MAFTIEDLALGDIEADVVIGITKKTSAFAKLAQAVALLPDRGLSIPRVTNMRAYGVGEGKQKVASGENDSVKMGSNKLQVSTVLTEELVASKVPVADAVMNQFPFVTARDLDLFVLGVHDKPADWSDFSTAAELATVEIADGTTSNLDDAYEAVDTGSVTGIMLTTKMLSYLRRQRLASGTRVYDITDDTIDGIPYATVISSEAVGIVGDFSQAYASVQEFKNVVDGTSYRIKDSGTITDSSGVEHNLTDSNKIAIQYEQIVGSAFAGAGLVRIVPAAVAGE